MLTKVCLFSAVSAPIFSRKKFTKNLTFKYFTLFPDRQNHRITSNYIWAEVWIFKRRQHLRDYKLSSPNVGGSSGMLQNVAEIVPKSIVCSPKVCWKRKSGESLPVCCVLPWWRLEAAQKGDALKRRFSWFPQWIPKLHKWKCCKMNALLGCKNRLRYSRERAF